MIDFFLISKIFILLIDIIGIWLAFWIYFANRKSRVNQLFFLLTIFILLWISFAHFANLSSETHQAILWTKLTFLAVFAFFISMYFFVNFFPREEKQPPLLSGAVVSIGVIFSLISVFTDLLVKDVAIREWGVLPIWGKGQIYMYGIIAILTFLILGILLKKYFRLSSVEKLKVQYFLIGIFIFAVMNLIFNIFLTPKYTDFPYYLFGNYSAIFFLSFTGYAIVKQELFGIRVVLTQALVGVIAIVLLAQAVTAINWLEFGWKFLIFLAFLYFGYFLIKSVILEIQRRQEIEKIDKAKSEFISIASHQLRTPLTAIKGYISMILEETYGKLAEKQARPLENVYRSNERLIKLVNDLLNLSRLDAGKIEFSPELNSLEDIVSDIVEELRINAEKKGLYMRMVKPSKPLPKIMVDRDKLRQVILNIIDNAIKYTNKGGITIELKKLDEQEEIKVSDTGEGMDEKELNSLFQMFSRATAGTQLHTEGAGLGLYVARQFIEMHGGKVWAESPGKSKGSTFYIQLPIHLDPKLLKTKTITKAPDDIF